MPDRSLPGSPILSCSPPRDIALPRWRPISLHRRRKADSGIFPTSRGPWPGRAGRVFASPSHGGIVHELDPARPARSGRGRIRHKLFAICHSVINWLERAASAGSESRPPCQAEFQDPPGIPVRRSPMSVHPVDDTSITLMVRLQRFPADPQAWDEFVERYRPMIRAGA